MTGGKVSHPRLGKLTGQWLKCFNTSMATVSQPVLDKYSTRAPRLWHKSIAAAKVPPEVSHAASKPRIEELGEVSANLQSLWSPWR